MNRRDVLKVGATVAAVPALAPAAQKEQSAAWKPAVLNRDQNETVIILTDLIIPATETPGAKAANVNRYIDLFLKDGPAGERERFLSGLKWLDAFTKKKHGAAFAKLDRSQQIAVLESLDSGEKDSALKEGNQFFRMVKSMTARIYYQTEAGYNELNKDGAPGGFGCKHSEHGA
jgi:hypothetical protein